MRYIYKCRDCDTRVEVDRPLGEQPAYVDCPECRGVAGRVFTAPTTIYKGTGWSGRGHGVPDMDERAKLPGPLDFSDLMGE
jgi:putative FmdB family regulatory protein